MKKKSGNAQTSSDELELKGFLSFLIIHELNLKRLCGDELSTNIGKRKGSSLTPGTIYPALKRLRKKKLIAYRRKGRKKTYFLTETGEKEIERLYSLFSQYFFGLKNKIVRQPAKKKVGAKKKSETTEK
ncbi:MAG: PadR family transcriptional regulator [Nanoarchaeota archaeon]|nr:PadR family transcriptional regulator [Nanoarchaeota archaeon]MBU1320988.1 PadR family transcriptional regulator [Nanoarchaeota archaeon]MBU1596859.1 PadR family transcriptional regulator [Nanoarchaeota archaeon]MBU2440802.1 PadR family transcriptional regulator [Nanoarchaeota archaeon]